MRKTRAEQHSFNMEHPFATTHKAGHTKILGTKTASRNIQEELGKGKGKYTGFFTKVDLGITGPAQAKFGGYRTEQVSARIKF